MLEAFYDRLQGAETLDELSNSVGFLRDLLKAEHVVYHSVKSTGDQYAAYTYQDEWVTRYLTEDYARIDPVVQSCLRRFQPIDWRYLDWSGKAIQSFMDEAAEMGVGDKGYSIPIRGPSGQFALFTISSLDRDAAWEKYTLEHTETLLLASHYVNQRALELERGTDILETVSLTPRETDTLTMLALGMNRAQAADRLAISEHTLRVYIESARLKLSAMNTTHAVARALSQGLLPV